MNTLLLPGSLTQANADSALASLMAGVNAATGSVEVNASALQRFDSVTLACLLELRRRAQGQGKRLSIVGLPQRLLDLAELYGVTGLLGVGSEARGT